MHPTIAQAEAAYNSSHYEVAYGLYLKLAEAQPNNKQSWEGLALSAFRLGRTDEALRIANKVLEAHVDSFMMHLVLGNIYAQRKSYEESEAELRRTLELNDKLPQAYASLGTVLLSLDRVNEAVSILEKGAGLGTKTWNIHYNLSIAYHRLEKHANAFGSAFVAFQNKPSLLTASNLIISFERTHYRTFILALSILLIIMGLKIQPILTLSIFVLLSIYSVVTILAFLQFRSFKNALMRISLIAILLVSLLLPAPW